MCYSRYCHRDGHRVRPEMTGAESKPVYTYTIADLVEDATTFTRRNYGKSVTPAPNSCAACGDEARNHAETWVTRTDGTSEYHRYETPSDALRIARMRARRN